MSSKALLAKYPVDKSKKAYMHAYRDSFDMFPSGSNDLIDDDDDDDDDDDEEEEEEDDESDSDDGDEQFSSICDTQGAVDNDSDDDLSDDDGDLCDDRLENMNDYPLAYVESCDHTEIKCIKLNVFDVRQLDGAVRYSPSVKGSREQAKAERSAEEKRISDAISCRHVYQKVTKTVWRAYICNLS